MEKEIAKNKTVEEKMALADEISRGYFRQGLNCTECVLRTFMDMYDVELPEDVLCMATGFWRRHWPHQKYMRCHHRRCYGPWNRKRTAESIWPKRRNGTAHQTSSGGYLSCFW